MSIAGKLTRPSSDFHEPGATTHGLPLEISRLVFTTVRRPRALHSNQAGVSTMQPDAPATDDEQHPLQGLVERFACGSDAASGP